MPVPYSSGACAVRVCGVYSTTYLGSRIRGGVSILSVCPFPVSPSLSAFTCTVMYRLCIDVHLSIGETIADRR